MGFRIFIENKSHTLAFYGTKHYGYCSVDIAELPSFKYLESIRKVESEDSLTLDAGVYFDPIILTAEQFNTFIKLYNEEYMSGISWNQPGNMLEDDEMIKLMNDKEDKEVSWG